MIFTKNSLFFKYKEFLILFSFCVILFLINISLEYKNFLIFKEQKHIFIENALVLKAYEKNKNNKIYKILLLKYKDFKIYTSVSKNFKISKNQIINLFIINKNINFISYLSKNFYTPSYKIQITNKKEENKIINYFLNQHQNEKIKQLYGALFFALPISTELRNDINHYGISHLIAISGYHISLIFAILFFILKPFYSFLQIRYFPYRNLKLDLSVFIFVFLFIYAYFIGFVPSFIRALIMSLYIFYMLIKNIKIISFINLLNIICICIALFPNLLFSIGFLLSILGVFYIYLYLHHFYKNFNLLTNIFFLNIWVFFMMIIPVLYFFPLISFQQLFGIFISFIFNIFYPLSLFLHILNFGNLFDDLSNVLLNFKMHSENLSLPISVFLSYILLSIISIFSKKLALFCAFSNFLCFVILF